MVKFNKDLIGKFFIIADVQFSDFMKDENDEIAIYDTYDDACLTCGMYEFANVLICEIKSNYIDNHEEE